MYSPDHDKQWQEPEAPELTLITATNYESAITGDRHDAHLTSRQLREFIPQGFLVARGSQVVQMIRTQYVAELLSCTYDPFRQTIIVPGHSARDTSENAPKQEYESHTKKTERMVRRQNFLLTDIESNAKRPRLLPREISQLQNLMGKYDEFFLTGANNTLGGATITNAMTVYGQASRAGIGSKDAEERHTVQRGMEVRSHEHRVRSEMNVWLDEQYDQGNRPNQTQQEEKRRKIEKEWKDKRMVGERDIQPHEVKRKRTLDDAEYDRLKTKLLSATFTKQQWNTAMFPERHDYPEVHLFDLRSSMSPYELVLRQRKLTHGENFFTSTGMSVSWFIRPPNNETLCGYWDDTCVVCERTIQPNEVFSRCAACHILTHGECVEKHMAFADAN